jgi:hypothetical protein
MSARSAPSLSWKGSAAWCIAGKSPVTSRLMPPLNQSLWTLLIASLFAVAGWGVVYLSAPVERERKERHSERDGHSDMSQDSR